MKKSIYETLEPGTLYSPFGPTAEIAAYLPVLTSIAISLKRIADYTATLQPNQPELEDI